MATKSGAGGVAVEGLAVVLVGRRGAGRWGQSILTEVMIVGTRRGPTVVGLGPFESEAVLPVEFNFPTATADSSAACR